MIPHYFECSSCYKKLEIRFREACYYMGGTALDKQVADQDLYRIPCRPAWCKDCECICIAEDIASLRVFEDAYGAARSGRPVEYPTETGYLDSAEAAKAVEPYLRWRMDRRHAARALCCGRSNFQFMDVAQPLIKHAECEFGFVKPRYMIGSYCGSGPGVRAEANIRLYDTEGELIGLLTWYKRDTDKWDVECISYPAVNEDD